MALSKSHNSENDSFWQKQGLQDFSCAKKRELEPARFSFSKSRK